MAYLAHFSSFKKSIKLNNKIPEYAKDFRKEWLYIQGINKKCVDLYYFMGNIFYADFFTDDEFQDFFENFIIFTNNVNIKYEENFEDDLYDINDYIGEEREIDSLSELSDFDSISESESESDSDD
ncbi:unnamed protein product [Porites lobata]|uniref:Uncharacterized protein n=1 Tax=Porites lobata TaxID=104759 RepID=A0ABN8QKU3_9CNID|nr:unnamed protein product [Porites lobata]